MRRVKVIGPPGTGKTTWMINQIAELIRRGYEPSSILATTFTRPGRRAIRQKVMELLRPERLVRRKSDIHWLGRTIHSVCKELLGIESKYVIDYWKLKEFCNAYGYRITQDQDYSGEEEGEYKEMMLVTAEDYYLHFIEWARHRCITDFETALYKFTRAYMDELPPEFNVASLRTFVQRYEEWKKENSYWDFTDFLQAVVKERLRPEGIRVICVDEAQDLSPLLWKVVSIWAYGCEVAIFVGDYLQSLYEFSGGDPSLLRDCYANETVFLEQSHRVPKKVWELDKKVMTSFRHWYEKDYLPTGEEGFVKAILPEELPRILDTGKKVFVMHRTRKLAGDFGEYLLSCGVLFKALRGRKTAIQRKEFELAVMLKKLAEGGSVPIDEFASLVADTSLIPSALYMRHGAKTELKRIANDNPDMEVTKDKLSALGFNMEFIKRLEQGRIFDLIKMEEKEKRVMEKMFAHLGESVANIEIYNGTIHAFKGEECDIAVINPALTRKTMLNMLSDPQEEARCFHVAITRAREGVYILRGMGKAEFPL